MEGRGRCTQSQIPTSYWRQTAEGGRHKIEPTTPRDISKYPSESLGMEEGGGPSYRVKSISRAAHMRARPCFSSKRATFVYTLSTQARTLGPAGSELFLRRRRLQWKRFRLGKW